jgi:hypothetical protein
VDVRAVNDSGEVPWDGTTQGELQVRGPSVAASYTGFISVPSWDGKKHPLPSKRIRVVVHEAIYVDRNNFDEIQKPKDAVDHPSG